jgi:hypothetical protein
MHRNHKIRFLFSAGAIVATLAFSAIPCVFAQSTPVREWSLVTVATIKPDMRSDFEVWQKEITTAYKKAEVPSRAVLQTVMGDPFEYVSVAPLVRFADMDGLSPIERALGKEDAVALMLKGSTYVTSVHRIASIALNDMSIRTKTSEPSEYALLTSMHLVAGKESEFNAWMKNEYLPAMKKAEVKNFWVSQTMFGGDPNERITLRLMKNMGEFDAGPVLTKALGEEGARKLRARSAGIIDSVHFSVLHYRADLSYDKTIQQLQATTSAK